MTEKQPTFSLSSTLNFANDSTKVTEAGSQGAQSSHVGTIPPQPRYRVFTLGQDTRSHPVFVSPDEAPCGSFLIDCNHCGRSIPNEHYHCSICDNGDYDLCPDCLESGVSCPGADHWLIKRFIIDGVVSTSTTETVSPRKPQSEDEKQEGKTPEALPAAVSETTPAPKPLPAPSEAEVKVNERTCNACFRGTDRFLSQCCSSDTNLLAEFDEAKMVTCTDCEDYDLCLTCLLKDGHGHHPAHSFSLIQDRTFCLKSLVLSRCRPGRHHHHAAICDGCDKVRSRLNRSVTCADFFQRIVGVRHKCLTCPDWDYCWECIEGAPQRHPGHRFVPIYEAIAEQPVRQETHYGIFCDGPLCKNKPSATYITGDRYKCAVCHDTDFCANCEALPTNPHNRTHPLIKFKTPVRNVSVSTYGDSGNGAVLTMGDRPKETTPQQKTPLAANNAPAPTPANAEEKQTEEARPENLSEKAVTKEVEKETKDETPKEEPEFATSGEEIKSDLVAASAQVSGYQAFFIRDTIRDGSKLPPNKIVQQTWTLYNPGPLPWPAGSNVRFVGGDSMFNVDTDRPSSLTDITSAMESNELSAPLLPGQSADFTVTLKTPQREGTSISYWRLKLPDGTPFGHKLWCDIQVRADAPEPAVAEAAEAKEVTEVKEETQQTSEVKKEPELTESDMIFPKLDKESPVTSTHESMPAAPTAPSLANTDERDILEDVESLTLEDEDTEGGFLTDDEYDILDASDQEFLDVRQSEK